MKWLAGTSHDDVFTGDENATRFAITGGNDVISAGAGNDEYDFGIRTAILLSPIMRILKE